MPHTNRKTSPPQPQFKPAQFVNIQISPAEKEAIKAEPWSESALNNAMQALTTAGYKITLRFDERNDCFACWLIAPDREPNKGYILAGRGSTPSKSIKQAAYIHFKMLEGDWTEGVQQQTEAIDD